MKTNVKQLARGLVAEIEARGASHLDDVTGAFVMYLAKRHELSLWREVVRALDAVWKEKFGVANVSVVSAFALPREVKETLEETFAGVSVTSRIEESVLGGASVRIDDRVIDGTIRARLQSLKQQLAN